MAGYLVGDLHNGAGQTPHPNEVEEPQVPVVLLLDCDFWKHCRKLQLYVAGYLVGDLL